jgi:DNA-directed RNA polymerase subunit RPC12/RpoP
MTVTCVRCGTSLPLGAADVVGTGYRCTRCTTQVEINGANDGMADVGDDLDPGLRVKLARKAKQRVWGGLAVLGALLAPLPIALMTGNLAVLVLGALGVCYSPWAGSAVMAAHHDSRRYGARGLPTATASLRTATPAKMLPPGDSSHR